VLRDADTAMYRAKADGKACYALFDSAMHHRAVAALDMESSPPGHRPAGRSCSTTSR
jgi:predicted signal transduction protein with EAL and GGDEF domain